MTSLRDQPALQSRAIRRWRRQTRELRSNMGCCSRDQLCDRCLADALAQLRGVAACRGEYWARSVAARTARTRPWPAYEGRCATIARDKVEDLGRDARLREELARLCAQWAARWWTS